MSPDPVAADPFAAGPFAASRAADAVLPAQRRASSDGLGWRSLLARSYLDLPRAEPFGTVPTDDPLVVLVTGGVYEIESRFGGRPRRAVYREGSVGITAPGSSGTLSWRALTPEPMTSLHLHLDAGMVREVAAELGPAARLPDALHAEDPLVRELARAAGRALRTGAPALYADALAHLLAVHLLVQRPLPDAPAGSGLAPAVLRRVVAHMHEHLAEDVTLDDLAAAARLSKHHLLRRFRDSTGTTPHRFLTELRMQRAAELLRGTARPVSSVAAACGYANASRFAAAFRRSHGTGPSGYRERERG